MSDRFEQVWAEGVHRVRDWQRGDDPSPVLEALGQAVVRHLVGILDRVDTGDREALLQASRPALAATRELALASAEDREAWLEAVALAELGRRLLAGEGAGDLSGVPRDLRRPTPRRTAAMLDGRVDGISAASCAVWFLLHDAGEPHLLWSLAEQAASTPSGDGEPVLVAAAEPEPIRAPDEGEVVGRHGDPPVEVVWFASDRQLAAYAADDVYVALAAPALTSRDLRPGYWLGSVDPRAPSDMEVELKVGDRRFTIRVRLA